MGLIALQLGITSYTNPFLFDQADYICPPSVTNCHEYVCSLPQEEHAIYLQNAKRRFVDKFGDFRCSGNEELEAAQIVVFTGGIIGVILAALLLSCFTQKSVLVTSLVLNLTGLVLAFFSQKLALGAIGLSINFCGRYFQIGIIFSFITESVGESSRKNYISFVTIFFALGPVTISLGYWFIQPWELVYIFFTIVPQAINLFVVLLFIEEIPFDLMTFKSAARALQGFKKIASFNGTECHIDEQQIQAIQDEYQLNLQEKNQRSFSFTDLFCFQSLRTMTILGIISRLLINFQFVIPGLYISNYAFNFYASGALMGGAECVANFIGMFTFPKVSRKITFYVAYSLNALIGLALWMLVPCLDKSQCSQTETNIQLSLLIIYRITNCYAHFLFLIYLSELFPTQVKGISLQVMALPAAVSYLFIPLLQGFYDSHHYSIFSCYFLISIIIIASLFPQKETFKITPPELVEELAYESQALKAE